MEVFRKITWETLKKNPTRTIAAMVGIIFSSMLICVVITFKLSMENYIGVPMQGNEDLGSKGIEVSFFILILFASVSLIYNAFAISVSERTKQFGLLSSIGATKRQIRSVVLWEAVFVGGMGIFLGVILGIGATAVILHFLGEKIMFLYGVDAPIKLYVSVAEVGKGCIFVFLIILISIWFPAKRATSITAIEAIRLSKDISVKQKDVKTGKFVYQLFGFEGMLAKKYYKRNHKKYRATVISLFTSIVLFVSASSFCGYMMKNINKTKNYDIYLEIDMLGQFQGVENKMDFEEERKKDEELYQALKKVEDVKDSVAVCQRIFQQIEFKEEDWSESYKKIQENKESYSINEFFGQNIQIVFMEETSYEKYLKDNGIVLEDNGNGIRPLYGILYDRNQIWDETKRQYITYSYLQDSCERITAIVGTSQKEYSLLIGNRATVPPMGVGNDGEEVKEQYMLIYPMDMCSVLLAELEREDSYLDMQMYFTSSNYERTFAAMKRVLRENDLFERVGEDIIFDYSETAEGKKVVGVFQVLMYAFIGTISLIAATNVFNTISANLNLRKRDFAVLKSIGLTEKGFYKMLHYECIQYGIQSLLFGLPASMLMSYFIFVTFSVVYAELKQEVRFFIPWTAVIIVVCSVFIVVFASMLYVAGKIKKVNIIDAVKDENI